MQKLCFGLASFLFLSLSGLARAEEEVLTKFNRDIKSVYVSASQCAGTVYPGPEQYIFLISDYFGKLYPNGANYWALPVVKDKQRDREVCITSLEGDLMQYQRSLYDFKISYPKRIQPPMLLAYKWREKEIKKETPIKPALPIYQPKGEQESRFK